MTDPIRLLAVTALVAATAACVPSGNNRVDTTAELEDTLSQDIDGDGTIIENGTVQPDNM